MPPAKWFNKLCAARATAIGWKSSAARFPAPGPRRLAVCRETSPAAPAMRRSWRMWLARLDVRTQGDKQSVTIRPQGGSDVTIVLIALRKG